MQPTDANQKAISAAIEIMNRDLSELNQQNTIELAATKHFPHFRLVGTSLKVWETADRYFDDFRAPAGDSWADTKLASITPISATSNKVHLDMRASRFDTRDQLIADFKSIWAITKVNRVWAAQLGSSFAPA